MGVKTTRSGEMPTLQPSKTVAASKRFLQSACYMILILEDISNKYKYRPPVRAISSRPAIASQSASLAENCSFFAEDGLHFLPNIFRTCLESRLFRV